MKLQVIGTNSAFVKKGLNNSFILWKSAHDGILLDCGYSIFQELLNQNIVDDVNTVLLSHQHQDHAGSAVTLLEYRYNILQKKTAIGGAWGTLLEHADGAHYDELTIPTDIDLEIFEVPHARGMQCIAMLVENKVLYSGDSAISVLDSNLAQKAEIIIHDISLKGGAIVGIDELGKAPKEIKAKTFVSHYKPDDYEFLCQKSKELGLGGVLKAGMTFEL